MERFRQVFWIGRLWAHLSAEVHGVLDSEVRLVLIGMLIMIVISAVILVANLIN
jgi:hypothetical protein